jgi:hypothetical protein
MTFAVNKATLGQVNLREIRFSPLVTILRVFNFHLLSVDLGVDGWIIFGWISSRWDVGIWTGMGWPRIQTVGGRLSVR